MKMPFPGMDPYLEHPLLWPSVHIQLMVSLANQLQPLIEPRYVASLEERVFIEGPQRQIVSDLLVKKLQNGGGPPLAERAVDTPVVLAVEDVEIHETYVEILDLYSSSKLVALIEVVSPTNKRKGPGRTSYLAKQRDTLARDCHLVEIDLLRRGRHVLTVPEWRVRELKPYDYLVCVSRWPQRNHFELYPQRLRDRLPRIRLPLADPDPDVPLDIQTALEQVYWDGRYMRRVRYQDPCEPRLPPKDQAWASERWAAYRAAHPELFAQGAS
jgi:hypothetical protein